MSDEPKPDPTRATVERQGPDPTKATVQPRAAHDQAEDTAGRSDRSDR